MRFVLGGAFLSLAFLSACTPDANCLAVPACDQSEAEGAACEDGEEDCREVTVCEQTIYCRGGGDAGPTDAG